MKRLFILLTFCSFTFGQIISEEFRATWVITWEHISSSDTPEEGKSRIRNILDDHVSANMNAVLFQIRQGGTAYYDSPFEPWGYYSGYANPGYDPLAYAIEQAHERGLELHAWFNTFQCSSTYPGSPSAEHPEWICRDQNGNPMTSYRALSPGLPAVREYTINVAMDIVNRYDIDGLHLDYVRWNEHSNGLNNQYQPSQEDELKRMDGIISDEELNAIHQRTGRYLYDASHPYSSGVPNGFSSWEDWWRSSVTTFVQSLHDSIQTVKPFVRLSTAVLGKYNWSGWQGYGTVYQDGALWFNEGYVDQLTPMHYHWTNTSGFTGMLENDCPDCWHSYIQPGLNQGRLFTVGPGSYILDDYNVWSNHNSIINAVRGVNWTSGFQFFNYGSWSYRDYWDEAKNSFFSSKSVIKETENTQSTTPNPPNLVIEKIDSLQYQINVNPTDEVGSWFSIYRSEDSTLSINTDPIIYIGFDHSPFSFTDSFDGIQNYNGEYTYFAKQYNRYWKPSPESNSVITDPIPSFAPELISSFPSHNDNNIPNDLTIQLTFSKSMDTAAVHQSISMSPQVEMGEFSWSPNENILEIELNEILSFGMEYTMTISQLAQDINGRPLELSPLDITFTVADEDIFGPVIIDGNFLVSGSTENWDYKNIISMVFNEWVEPATIESGISLETISGNPVDFELNHASFDDYSTIAILPINGEFTPIENYNLFLTSSLTDALGNAYSPSISSIGISPFHYSENIIIDHFSSTSNWWQPTESGSTVGVLSGTNFNTNNEVTIPTTSPSSSARLSYVWDLDAPNHLIRAYLSGRSPRNVEFDNSYILQAYIYGDGGQNKFRFCLDDNLPSTAGSYHEVSEWLTIDWIGWRLIEWDLDSDPVGSWLGNQILEGILRIDSIQLTRGNNNPSTSGVIYIDELRIVKKEEQLEIVQDASTIPEDFYLSQNYPNPFNGSTIIPFSIPKESNVRLIIYNLKGELIAELLNKKMYSGDYKEKWNGFDSFGNQVASGVYYYQLFYNGIAKSNQMIYLK